MRQIFLILLILLIFHDFTGFAQDEPIRIDFSGATTEENGITAMGADFDIIPIGDISFGKIPTDNAFDDATDGVGAIIQAAPGQGVMIFGPVIESPNPAMIRCSIRTDGSHGAITIASIDQGSDIFVSTSSPNGGSFSFIDRYKRLTTFCVPPSTGFQPLLQVVNTSNIVPLTVYVDNFDVYLFDPERYYSTKFFDGDETDPELISVEPFEQPTPTPPLITPIPTEIPTVIQTNTPVSTSDGIINPETGLEEITINIPDFPDGAKPLEMVRIPAGTFIMGSPNDELGRQLDETQHQVTISTPFYIGKYEITRAQWNAVIAIKNWSDIGNFYMNIDEINFPANRRKGYDCMRFCNVLSEIMGKRPVYDENTWVANMNANGYRFPTEAEWEYACRAGTTTRFSFGDALECMGDEYCEIMDRYVWWNANNNGVREIGLKLPNPWGLYDMHGNVWERCIDLLGSYTNDAQIDPTGPEWGTSRVMRGGSYHRSAEHCRSSNRDGGSLITSGDTIGFRIVRSISIAPTPTPNNIIPDPTEIPTDIPTREPTLIPTSTLKPTTGGNINPITGLEEITIDIPGLPVGAKKLEMVCIPAGTFTMGSPPDERGRTWNGDEGPQHRVTISQPFYLGKYEVTLAQWNSVMDRKPTWCSNVGDNYPVCSVSWYDCQTFIEKMNELGIGTYRMPTEAEWEYACRAGTTTRFSFGDAFECSDDWEEGIDPAIIYCDEMDKYMWWWGNNEYTDRGGIGTAKEVGLKLPNSWGLFDMHGNVFEWCSDWYGWYSSNPQLDPLGSTSGKERILRGGSFYDGATGCRSAYRHTNIPEIRSFEEYGFRLLRLYP